MEVMRSSQEALLTIVEVRTTQNALWPGALVKPCYLEAAESDCTTDQHKAGLKSAVLFNGHINQIVSCAYIGGFTTRLHYAALMIRQGCSQSFLALPCTQ